jgi:predicted nucleotidyltransferase
MSKKAKKKYRKLDPAVLQDILARIVKIAKPEKIILFGSAARGQMGPNSDVDLLIIKSGRYNHGRLIDKLYMNMEGEEAVDILIFTPQEIEQYRDCPYLVIYPALREGKVVYAA